MSHHISEHVRHWRISYWVEGEERCDYVSAKTAVLARRKFVRCHPAQCRITLIQQRFPEYTSS